MKTLNENAHQIYQVSSEYARFDQKYHMARRIEWDWTEFAKTAMDNRIERIKGGRTGYGLNDWALFRASDSLRRVANTNSHVSNRGHLSWSKISAAPPPGVDRLNGSPDKTSRYIRKAGRMFGADLVGISKIDRRWVYSRWYDEESRESYPILFSDEIDQACHSPVFLEDRSMVIPKAMDTVIVIGVAMDREGIDAGPTLVAMGTLGTAYGKLATMALGVAEFIRGMGYNALPMLNDIGMSIPLAIDAGLGQLGRHGLVITPQFGPRLRMCKVLTDMPAEPDRPIDFGVTAFCESCKKCAIHCPAGALSHGARSREVETISSNPGTLKWPFNAEKCRTYQMKVGSNCCTCIRVCPFNKSSHWFHSVVRWFIETIPPLNPLMIKMDDVFGFGKFKDPEAHFWR